MADASGGVDPPDRVTYTVDEALELLGILEDARDALALSGYLTVVIAVEDEVRELERRLGFDGGGGPDVR